MRSANFALLVLLVASIFAGSARQKAAAEGCPTGTTQVGERREETADAIIVHPLCQQMAVTPAASSTPRTIFKECPSGTTQIGARSELNGGVNTVTPVCARGLLPEEKRAAEMIRSMTALAKKFGWKPEKLSQLNAALNNLDLKEDHTGSPAQIRNIWNDILNRREDFAREALAGGGPGIPGAGQQTHHADCAIFALANAAGLRYEDVAARASRLISAGDWHSAGERKNPRDIIENVGLNGGEVVMLAEALGQATIVPKENFDDALKGGDRIMVNLVPYNGGDGGHEVVLTRTFQHDGASWYEMMDSNQGPVRRLYLSGAELGAMLRENGISFRPGAAAAIGR